MTTVHTTGDEAMDGTREMQVLVAAERGDVATLEALVAEDPSLVNAIGEYGKTPLHWAAEKNHYAVAEILLARGADVDRTTTWGATPLEWAGYMGSTEVADALIASGAAGMNLVLAAGLGKLDLVEEYCRTNPTVDHLGIPKRATDENDSKGWPPDAARMKGDVLGEAFQLACRNGHVDVASFLLERGADIEAKGYFGGTGLHWAAINGHRDVVEFLLAQGADTELADHGFQATAEGWAIEGGHDDLAILIRRHRSIGGLHIEHTPSDGL